MDNANAEQTQTLPSLYDIRIALARQDLGEYFELSNGFAPAKHQKEILDKLQDFLTMCWNTPAGKHDKLRVLNINLPPGAGKSSIISASSPQWILGQRPHERIGIISAQGTLSSLFENTVKADIETGEIYQKCFPNPDCRPDKTRGWARGTLYLKGLPRGEATPSIVAAGLYGSVIGRRFTMLILDDPQDQEMIMTAEQREKSWNYLDTTILSRVIPGSPVICVQQRWAEDDVSGRLEKLYDAEVVKVRALDDDNNSYWPEMYSKEYLEQRRIANPLMFQANYQQEPGKGDGDVFKREWFRHYETRTSGLYVNDEKGQKFLERDRGYIYQCWDTAFKKGAENDYSAMVEARVDPITKDVYVTDFYWQKLEFPELLEKVKYYYGARKPRTVIVEDKASGTSLVQMLERQTSLPIKKFKPDTDKLNRARSITGWFDAGKVLFPQNHMKLGEFENFLTGFPFASHDDIVDAMTMLLINVISSAGEDFGIG